MKSGNRVERSFGTPAISARKTADLVPAQAQEAIRVFLEDAPLLLFAWKLRAGSAADGGSNISFRISREKGVRISPDAHFANAMFWRISSIVDSARPIRRCNTYRILPGMVWFRRAGLRPISIRNRRRSGPW